MSNRRVIFERGASILKELEEWEKVLIYLNDENFQKLNSNYKRVEFISSGAKFSVDFVEEILDIGFADLYNYSQNRVLELEQKLSNLK